MSVILAVLACNQGNGGHGQLRPEPPPPCESTPCAAVLGEAIWEGPDFPASGGYDLALHDGILLVGSPVVPGEYGGNPFVAALTVEGWTQVGAWNGEETFDLTGVSVAMLDLDGDGVPEAAVGDPNRQPSGSLHGAVHLLSGLPTGPQDIWEEALLTFYSPEHVQVGARVEFAAVLEDTPPVLLASGLGMLPDWPGCVYAIDPALRGELTETDATRKLCGNPGLGARVDAWDGDVDGQLDLAVSTPDGIGWFRGPWEADLTAGDTDVEWTQDAALGWDIGEHLETLGDVSGDGEHDLGFAAGNHGEPAERAGRAYVVPAGDLQPGPADDLAIQLRGTERGEGMGYGLASGDVDGDGQPDLLIGASGVFPGEWPGKVLVYRGPIETGVYEPADADAVVHGEYTFDNFGRAIETADLDEDGQEDLLVSASGWPSGQSRGAVYLVYGSDLFP